MTDSSIPSFSASEEVTQLIHGFEQGSLPREQWTHTAHLTVALWYLTRYPRKEATDRIRRGIQTYNLACGTENTDTSGYHETLTLFWIGAVSAFLSEQTAGDGAPASMVELANGLLGSPYADRELPLRYYSKPYLMSTAARRAWAEPDQQPLPVHFGCV